ncbi:MAG: glycosyltransferase family 4 protein [Deferribacterales bacterium]
MKIYYDNIIYFLQNSGGISRYWHELSMRLLETDDARFIERLGACGNKVRESFSIPSENIIYEPDLPLIMSRYLPLSIDVETPAVFHSSYYRDLTNKKIKKIITVHDFTYEHLFKGLRRLVHTTQKRHAVKNADGIICISENTKRDLLRFFPKTPEERITVIHNGVSGGFTPSVRTRLELRNSLNLPDDTFTVFVGERGGYKNFETAVTASAMSGCFLLILGGKELNEKEKILLEKHLKDRYRKFGFISNDTMRDIYSVSLCLLYPSLYEGFGIPVLEAMKCGCPAIASNTSSLPESAGDGGVLVDEISPEGFSDAIDRLKRGGHRDEIVRKGFAHAAMFSWDRCFNETKAFYEKILSL